MIKLENPRGGDFARHYDDDVEGMAAHFVWVNRGKESLALDLEDPRGLAALHRLLAAADALVSNHLQRALRRDRGARRPVRMAGRRRRRPRHVVMFDVMAELMGYTLHWPNRGGAAAAGAGLARRRPVRRVRHRR